MVDRAGNVNFININIKIPIDYEIQFPDFARIPTEGDVNIPKYFVNGNKLYKIVAIHELFAGCEKLTSVTIPDSVTNIGDITFLNCTSLTSITIPNSVTKIGYRAFENCTNLSEITIPNSVTEIGKNAFNYCSNLTNVKLSDNLSIISEMLFYECIKLNKIIIPNKVTSISNSAFMRCEALNEIVISDAVESIERMAFHKCINLKSIYIPINVKNIFGYDTLDVYSSGVVFTGCSPELKIYCGVENAPSGYKYYWNALNCKAENSIILETIYGVTREEYENNYKI